MAEQSCLLSSCTGKTGAAGSNPAPSATLRMPAFAYILRNRTSGRHYIGSTTDLDRRLSDHQRGNTPSTRNRGRWELVYSEECADLKAARNVSGRSRAIGVECNSRPCWSGAAPAERDCTGKTGAAGSNPAPSASWEMKSLARPLCGLASGFSGKFYLVV